jgi:uncharacterized membrane protein
MTTDHPLVHRYLTAFEEALAATAPDDRADIVAEIRQHIADAQAAGRTLDDILNALGPVDALARAYALELAISPRSAPREPRSDRWLKILGLMAIASLPSFIVLTVLGTIGIAFTLSGLAVVIAGIADATGALPGWIQNDIGPAAAIVTGVGLTVAGLLSGWGAVAYTRFLTRLVRRVLPSHPAHS